MEVPGSISQGGNVLNLIIHSLNVHVLMSYFPGFPVSFIGSMALGYL